MSNKNEFLRDKPKGNHRKLIYDLTNLIIPVIIIIIGAFLSSQKFAEYVNYDPAFCDEPIYILKHQFFRYPEGYPIFNPLVIALTMISSPFDMYIQEAIAHSILPGVICAILGIFSWLAISIIRSVGLNKNENLYGTARWGTPKDLKKFGLCEKNGVVLAQQWSAVSEQAINKQGNFSLKIKKNAPLICHQGTSHTLMIAPTRSGKGTGSIVPTCVSYKNSMIIFDPKGELYNMTAGYRKKFSTVIKFSPVQFETACFNPLEEVELNQNAFRDIGTILQNLFQKSEKGGDSNSEFFDNNARDLLTGVIFHVLSAVDNEGNKLYKKEDRTIAGVLRILARAASDVDEDGEPLPAGEALLDEMVESKHLDKDGRESDYIHAIVLDVALSAKQQHEKIRSDIMQTIQSKLNLFRDPFITNATSRSDFKLQDFYDSPHPISLYLTLPFGDIDRIMPVFQLIIDFILRKFSSGEIRAGEKEKTLKIPILFLLDEFPTLGKMKFLSTSMGVLAGYGLRFFIVVQMFTQIIDIYGANNTFIANCRYIIIYKPSEPRDQELFCKMIGKESVTKENMSVSGSRFQIALNNLNASSQEISRDLINTDELAKLPYTDAIIFGEGMPAYMAKKCAFYEDERFKWKVFYEDQDTGKIKSGFKAPYEQEEINAECATLPSQKNNLQIELKRETNQKNQTNEHIETKQIKGDFNVCEFLETFNMKDTETADEWDAPFTGEDEEDELGPPPTVGSFAIDDFSYAM